MYCPAHVVEHKGRNYRAYKTEYDEYTGTVVVIVTDNIHSGGEIWPVGEHGERCLTNMVYEAIGGPNWDQKYVDMEPSASAVKSLTQAMADLHVYPWLNKRKPKPVKALRKVKKLKRRA